jgi:DNA repair protein RadB
MKGEQRRDSGDTHVSTGCDGLDGVLGGGFPRGAVSQVYGEPSTGKTNICMQTAVETVEDGGGVVYIDTEGLSLERLRQIGGENIEDSAHDFIIKDVYDFDEQAVAVRDVESLAADTDLVVLDSATGLYRVEQQQQDDEESALRRLTRQVTQLTGMARRYDLAVVATNQIYTAVESTTEEIAPLGGRAMEHWTKIIMRLERSAVSEKRQATVEKHPSKRSGVDTEFRITDSGVEDA